MLRTIHPAKAYDDESVMNGVEASVMMAKQLQAVSSWELVHAAYLQDVVLICHDIPNQNSQYACSQLSNFVLLILPPGRGEAAVPLAGWS